MSINVFEAAETVGIWAYIRDWEGNYETPDNGVKITLTDPKGVIKAGHISVVASADFAVGLLVTGETSGATAIVMGKPDATTLHLQQVTGIWEFNETITDTGAGGIGESTTTSILLAAPMSELEGETGKGKYVYYYNSQSGDAKGWWRYSCKSQDGTGGEAKYTVVNGSFELK